MSCRPGGSASSPSPLLASHGVEMVTALCRTPRRETRGPQLLCPLRGAAPSLRPRLCQATSKQ
eukprot:12655894-Alexandrium_andersonii.AAC.1